MLENTSLRDFTSRAAASGRICFGDLRRLQRVIPNGITTQEDAEALLDLDQAVSRADPDWPSWLSSTLKAYAVSGGHVDPQKAAWLAKRLVARRTKAAQALARQLATEAKHEVESDVSAEVRPDLSEERKGEPPVACTEPRRGFFMPPSAGAVRKLVHGPDQ